MASYVALCLHTPRLQGCRSPSYMLGTSRRLGYNGHAGLIMRKHLLAGYRLQLFCWRVGCPCVLQLAAVCVICGVYVILHAAVCAGLSPRCRFIRAG